MTPSTSYIISVNLLCGPNGHGKLCSEERRTESMDFMIVGGRGYDRGDNGGDERLKPWMAMVGIQVFNAGSNLLFKKILSDGCFIVPTLTYRNIVGALSVAPLALVFERDLTWKELYMMVKYTFYPALFLVTLSLVSLYYGMRETTAALASNVMNITPAFSFIMAIFARVEKLNFGSRAGKFKVLGTILCIVGAILSMIKYPQANNWYGTCLLIAASTAHGCGQTFLGKLKGYSATFWMTTLICLYASIQSAIIGCFTNTEKDDWTLKWNLHLFTIFYSGFLNTAAAYFILSWVIPKRGYIYPSMFTSVSVFVTAIADCQMGEHTSFRSFLGMMIIIGGLQVYLWAKAKEEEEEEEEGNE